MWRWIIFLEVCVVCGCFIVFSVSVSFLIVVFIDMLDLYFETRKKLRAYKNEHR